MRIDSGDLGELAGEARRKLDRRIERLQPETREHIASVLSELEEKLHELHLELRTLLSEKARLARERGSARRAEIERQLEQFSNDFRDHVKEWKRQRRLLLAAVPA